MTRQERWDADFRAIVAALLSTSGAGTGTYRGRMLEIAEEIADAMETIREARSAEDTPP